jgi:hypothetical protein
MPAWSACSGALGELAMELFPIFYAFAFLILAGAGCAFCWSFDVLRRFAQKAFVAILAFGAASCVGLVLVLIAVESSPLTKWLSNGSGSSVVIAVAYIIPGVAGSLLGISCLNRIASDRRRAA